MVITYRNPIDCLRSSMQRYDMKPTEVNIYEQIKALKKYGLDDLVSVFNHPYVLKLKYEDFYEDFDLIFDSIESYFNIEIPATKRAYLKEKYRVKNVYEKKISKLAGFNDHDAVTQWHGNHISSYLGKPNSYEHFFSGQQLDYIEKELSEYLTFLGYRNKDE